MAEGLFSTQQPITVAPLTGGADNAANVAAKLQAGRRTIQFTDGGAFPWATPLDLSTYSNVNLLGGEGATGTSSISNAGFSSDAFYFDGTPDAPDNTGTIASTPARGAVTISVTGMTKPVVGRFLTVKHATSMEVFPVLSVSGSSAPFTVTIRDSDGAGFPTGLAWSSGDTVQELTARPIGIHVDGRGMTWTGTGAQIFEGARCDSCTVENVRIVATAGTTGFGWDLGGRRNRARQLDVIVKGSGPQVGFYAQSNEDGYFDDCFSSGAQYGCEILDCVRFGVTRSTVMSASIGWVYGSLPDGTTASLGNLDCYGIALGALACPTGFNVFGSTGTTLSDCSALVCSSFGFLIESTAAHAHTIATSGTTLRSDKSRYCDVGVSIGTGVAYTTILDHNADGCTTAALQAAGNVVVDGFVATGMNVTTAVSLSCPSADIARMSLNNAGTICIQFGGTSASIRDSDATSGDLCYYVTVGRVRLDRCKATGTRGLYVTSGCFADVGPGCDFSGATTPIDFSGTGTITMVQTGGVAAVSATASLTFAQHYNTAIELASGATGDATITTYPIPGMTWVARNLSAHNLLVKTTNAGTITVAAGKTAIVAVNASGVMTRVTADN